MSDSHAAPLGGTGRSGPGRLSFGQRLWQGRWGYLFILPGLVGVGVFLVYPIAQAVWLSLFRAGARDREFIGADNYTRILSDPTVNQALINTALFVIGVVPATVFLGLLLAVGIQSSWRRARPFLRVAFYLPAVAGGVVLSFVWRWMLNPPGGVIPELLDAIGVRSPIFLGDPAWAIWALSLVAITFSLGPTVLLYMAGLSQVNPQLAEAASLDGASSWQILRHITIPSLRPMTLFVIVVTTISTLQIWDIVYLMTEGGPAYGTTTLGFLVFQRAFQFNEFGYASAIGVVLMVLVAGVAVVQFRVLGHRS